MNRDEIGRLLRAAAARDNRKLTKERTDAWFADLHDLPFGLALAALILHYRTSTEYLMPAHIRHNAQVLAHQRRRELRLQREATAAHADRQARDTRPLTDRSPQVQALVRDIAARLTTPTSQALTARWRARRMTNHRSTPAQPSTAAAEPSPAVKLTAHDIVHRESQAIQALHDAGRPCGSPDCDRPGCQPS